MTIKELVDHLQKYPESTQVLIESSYGEYSPVEIGRVSEDYENCVVLDCYAK